MIKSIFGRLAVIVLAASLLAGYASTAQAQTVIVVDGQKVLRDSQVGQHVRRQLESIKSQMEAEAKSSASPLVSERDSLMAQLKDMDMATLKARPDLTKRAQELQVKGQKQSVENRYKQQELLMTEQEAFVKVAEKVDSIIKALAAEKNASVVLDKSMTIYTAGSVDMTSTVLSRLNSQMQTTPVNRKRLPRQ